MFQRLKVFARLSPYIRENTRLLTLGGVMLFTANYLDVKVLVMLGLGIDVLGWNLGAFAGAEMFLLSLLTGIIFAMALGGAVARFWMRWLIIGASRQIEFHYRDDIFAHLERMPASFYTRYSTGDLMSRTTNDLEAVRQVIGPAVMYLSGTAVMLPMSLWQMFKISPMLTLFTWLPLVLIAPLFYFFSQRIHAISTRVQETFSDISTRVQETLTGIRVIKAYAAEDQESEGFAGLSRTYVAQNIQLSLLQAFFIPLMGFIISLSLLALVWAGGIMIVGQNGAPGGITQGSLISFFVLLMANIWPLAAIGWVMSLVERGSASMARLNEIMDAQPELPEQACEAAAKGLEKGGALDGEPAAIVPMRGAVTLRDLTFTYPSAASPALCNIKLDLPAGTILGLTGPVGCGKSTLAQLLARRFNPSRGMLLVDGRDILDWPLREYRRQVAIVDQEPFLFSDTIAANICYGLPAVDPEAVARASAIAQFSADVAGFPNGFDTLLGERGINLSGGQRQRAALARAIAMDPAILILDDALAAVDTHTEEAILRGLREFMKGRTTLLISHRISTMSLADHILYLDQGSIVEEGSHEQLLVLGGHYWSLARRQQLAEEIEATA